MAKSPKKKATKKAAVKPVVKKAPLKRVITRTTAKSIICAGILAKHSVNAILKKVHSKMPESKADAVHIRTYASQMAKEGLIKEDVRSKYVKTSGRPATKKAKPAKAVKPTKTAKPTKASKGKKKGKKSGSKKR